MAAGAGATPTPQPAPDQHIKEQQMSSGVTQAVNDLAHTLGTCVDWQALAEHMGTQPVMRLITLASTAAYSASAHDQQQAAINDLLDTAAGQAGLDDTQQTSGAALAGMSLDFDEQRHAAMAQARELLDPLTTLGVLRPLAG